MGTIIGVGGKGGFLDARGQLPRANRVLLVDSLGAAFGGLANSSSNTTYIESAAGVAEGGRTGLVSVVTGILFLVAMWFSPLASVIPAQATAPALIIVGFYMMSVAREIAWDDYEEAIPGVRDDAGHAASPGPSPTASARDSSPTSRSRSSTGAAARVHWMLYLAARRSSSTSARR